MTWTLHQLLHHHQDLLLFSQVKNQDSSWLPKAVPWKEPDWLHVKSQVSLWSNPYSYLEQKLNNSSKMPLEWGSGGGVRKPYCWTPSPPHRLSPEANCTRGRELTGHTALGEWGQKLSSISKNCCKHLCSLPEQSHPQGLSGEVTAPSVPRGQYRAL